MTIQSDTRVSAKLFVGCHLNSELRMHLNQSKSWRLNAILSPEDRKNLIEINYQHKEYIGQYLPSEKVNLPDLRQIEHYVKEMLHSYCPEYNIDLLKIYIFPQLFIA